MAKSGIDKMLDSIKNRDNDDPVGLKKKKKDIEEKNPTQHLGRGFDGIIDSISKRADDDPIGQKKSKGLKLLEKDLDKIDKEGKFVSWDDAKKELDIDDEPKKKKKRGRGFDSIIDDINERDDDDPTGTNKKKVKSKKKEDKEENPLHEAARSVGDLMGIGVTSTLGMGVVKGIGNVLKKE